MDERGLEITPDYMAISLIYRACGLIEPRILEPIAGHSCVPTRLSLLPQGWFRDRGVPEQQKSFFRSANRVPTPLIRFSSITKSKKVEYGDN